MHTRAKTQTHRGVKRSGRDCNHFTPMASFSDVSTSPSRSATASIFVPLNHRPKTGSNVKQEEPNHNIGGSPTVRRQKKHYRLVCDSPCLVPLLIYIFVTPVLFYKAKYQSTFATPVGNFNDFCDKSYRAIHLPPPLPMICIELLYLIASSV